jgi:hypothetical protein
MRAKTQQPDTGFFYYNPFTDADIIVFPRDRPAGRVFTLKAIHPFAREYDCVNGEKLAIACNGKIRVTRDSAGNVLCHVNGRTTERYSIKYTGRKQKQRFASY